MNYKLFLVAYACEPGQGSEHEVGWKTAVSLSESQHITVITRLANQKKIEEYSQKVENIDFVFIENIFLNLIKKRGKFSYLYYIFWQFTVFKYLKSKVNQSDIVHYITFGNIHLPTFIHFIKCRLFIGPMGGGSLVDYRLINKPKLFTIFRFMVHKTINGLSRFNILLRQLLRESEVIYLRTNESLNLVPKAYRDKVKVFLETGVESKNITSQAKKRQLKRIITASRLIESKNIDQVIATFYKIQKLVSHEIKLQIIGNGPLLNKLKKEHSSKFIEFLGKLPRHETLNCIKAADLYLSCSIKEGGSHSLFESAALNCPIACYHISGMEIFPKNESSIKVIPSYNIENNTTILAEKVVHYFQNNLIDDICRKNQEDLMSNYSWESVASRFINDYSIDNTPKDNK